MAEPSPGAKVRNPYPGLRPFRTDEEHLFFGREHQVDRMIDKLAAQRFLAVVGTSGSGKSSLVNCGLRPALHRGHMASAGAAWRMAQFRPENDPLGKLALALSAPGVLYSAAAIATMARKGLPTAELVDLTLRLGSLGLVDMVEQARLPAGTQLLVVVDQFEELFRFRSTAHAPAHATADDAVAFVQLLLAAAAQTKVAIHVVLTMRSDFLGDCAQFRGLPEAINEGQYLVPRLTRDEIRAAITGPAGVAQAQIGPLLLTRLLNDVGDNPDQLSILQHALNRTWFHWESAGASGPLALAHYEAAGGMAQALDMHANKAFAELAGPAQQRLCERLFKALTDTGTDARGIRRPKRLDELAAITGATADELQQVLNIFRKPSRSFLMPPLAEPLGPDSVIDISHESLMRVWVQLKTWADEEAQSARIYRRLRETALEHQGKRASLWRDPDLRVVLDWRDRQPPTAAWAAMYGGEFELATAFLDRSRDVQEADKLEAEIERRWLAGWNYLPLGLVAVLFLMLHGWFSAKLVHLIPVATAGKFLLLPLDFWRECLIWGANFAVGAPAVLGYLVLAAWGKKKFRRWQLARMNRPYVAPEPAEEIRNPLAPAADGAVLLHATGYASVARRATAQALDWGLILSPFILLMIVGLLADDGSAGSAAPAVPPDASALTTPVASVVGSAVPGAAGADGASSPLASTVASTVAPEAAATVFETVLGFVIIFGFWSLLFWAYNVRAWTGKRQGTLGMRWVGIFITDLKGQPLGRWRATGRFFARFLSYYSGYGFWLQNVNGRRQTLHDRISGSVVLRRPPKAPTPAPAPTSPAPKL